MNEENTSVTLEEISARLPEGYVLVEKDAWIPRQEAEDRIRALTFDREVDLELTRCGAKSLTAARSLLDLAALREQPGEVKSAVGKIRKENDWLFSREPLMTSGMTLQPRASADVERMTDAEYYAYRKQMKGN